MNYNKTHLSICIKIIPLSGLGGRNIPGGILLFAFCCMREISPCGMLVVVYSPENET